MAQTDVRDEVERSTSRRKRMIVGAGPAIAVAAVVVLVWFQPQKLFIDKTVDEAAPAARPAAAAVDDARATPAPPEPKGSFRSLTHHTEGDAIVTTSADGSRFVRFENFETDNGPDVVVWLSGGDDGSYASDFIDLGPLKGNRGNQNYAIPEGTDLKKYDTVVVWCRRFTVAFGAASLA